MRAIKLPQTITVLIALIINMLQMGCSVNKEEMPFDTDGRPISFVPEVTVTRGPLLNQFPDGGCFGVLGYCFVNGQSGMADWETKKMQAVPDQFYNQSVTYALTAGCVYSPVKFWSNQVQDKYTFFAYYPYNEVNPETGAGDLIALTPAKEAGAPILTYTLPFESSDQNTVLPLDKMQDVMISNLIDRMSNMGPVSFLFKHILTSFDFAVNNYNSRKNIIITSLALRGTFHKSIAINMETNDYSVSGLYRGTFQMLETPWIVKPNAASGMEHISSKNMLLLVPQILRPESLSSINWFVDVEASSEQGMPVRKTFELGSVLKNVNFESGIRYIFCIDFNGDASTIRIEKSSSWDTPENENNDVTFE